ncbi:quercetin 2,3-dioxygenase [Solimonas fluminis]|uniref:Quercetin 2,3-dioxygenase n=1 Tax=Solimonas fluminis TaxID=2086571 RepID=A0A2S5TFL4_9GAMM|nr:pirin family protein [Solimonas fluminis]PPE73780.1 quercetin 2,3-dioxygenase [Solimonas fluminis]
MSTRKLQQVIDAQPTSDGAGVKLRRSIGSLPGLRLDPFLMLDEFSSEEASDYIAGFPSHPHRGFETVTYMLDGRMRHEDHMGNRGDLGPGDVQWMSAARGIIHSEMPQQKEGRMRGFQLWINLPAREKMKPASYRDIPAGEIPVVALPGGAQVKVIAGQVEADGLRTEGAIRGVSTEPVYLDVALPAGARFEQALPEAHNAFVYAYEGSLRIGEREVPRHAAGVLSAGSRFEAEAGPEGARFILLAGKPLREPVVQYGPFVMNTREEIEQALDDYRRGRLAA